jgi:hypothetical protein
MTEEEWKDFERAAESRDDPRIVLVSKYDLAILAAYRELKERREDEEWLKGEPERLFWTGLDEMFYIGWCDSDKDQRGPFPTIHAAVTAAREGKAEK